MRESPLSPPIRLPRIKICGFTDPGDFAGWSDTPVDAVGLNFFPGSKRFLREEHRAAVVAAVPPGVARVGVFVNESPKRIREIAAACRLDWVQLHGDESPEEEASLTDLCIIRAIRCVGSPAAAVSSYLRERDRVGAGAAAVLLDAWRPGEWGGTGATLPWEELGDLFASRPDIRWLLAGGLTEENVASAIAAARPFGVDVAGGVEFAPGRKDAAKIRRFAERADSALRRLNR